MSLLRPDDLIRSVSDITPEFLAARGLRGLLLDLDNTLVPYHSYDDFPRSARWVEEISGSGIRLALLSNATVKRAGEWRSRLALEGVGMAGKPYPASFRRAAAALGLPAYQVGMVGDQLFTDVLGGNLAGLHTILVHPLVDNALPHTRLARMLERRVLARYGHAWGPDIWQPGGPEDPHEP
ncbi:haloacid dehalogenase [Deinococcus piscis]|uniref:Haloacid dehalogenase n=1 Tax=Deinococcus piscis TaxID=394230 RepID=A0ABQ3K487_9DEIO|nr:YqeG family HAD IIIA-type phosphatase [Deinococcus piscis]GHG03187.1 haloacid dehalogenase [Deinococcus piscis]